MKPKIKSTTNAVKTKSRLALRVNPDLLEKARSYAEDNRRTVTSVIEQALEEFLKTSKLRK